MQGNEKKEKLYTKRMQFVIKVLRCVTYLYMRVALDYNLFYPRVNI
jgi:hypothetical protein